MGGRHNRINNRRGWRHGVYCEMVLLRRSAIPQFIFQLHVYGIIRVGQGILRRKYELIVAGVRCRTRHFKLVFISDCKQAFAQIQIRSAFNETRDHLGGRIGCKTVVCWGNHPGDNRGHGIDKNIHQFGSQPVAGFIFRPDLDLSTRSAMKMIRG